MGCGCGGGLCAGQNREECRSGGLEELSVLA